MQNRIYGYSDKYLYDANIKCYYSNIYLPKILLKRVLYWYHFYINDLDVGRLANKIQQVC